MLSFFQNFKIFNGDVMFYKDNVKNIIQIQKTTLTLNNALQMGQHKPKNKATQEAYYHSIKKAAKIKQFYVSKIAINIKNLFIL